MKRIINASIMPLSVIFFIVALLSVLGVIDCIPLFPMLGFLFMLVLIPQDHFRLARCILARMEILISSSILLFFFGLINWRIDEVWKNLFQNNCWMVLLFFALAPLVQIRDEIDLGLLLDREIKHRKAYYATILLPFVFGVLRILKALSSDYGWSSGLVPFALIFMLCTGTAGLARKRNYILRWLPTIMAIDAYDLSLPNNISNAWFIRNTLYFAILAANTLPELASEAVLFFKQHFIRKRTSTLTF